MLALRLSMGALSDFSAIRIHVYMLKKTNNRIRLGGAEKLASEEDIL